ncbi:hypothetical protein BX666DRAFT_1964973 [Dichotomocladium elegans]|nr:hypothetical protein BX666DRAFT_1964973 [Dichotomocladium elegans]
MLNQEVLVVTVTGRTRLHHTDFGVTWLVSPAALEFFPYLNILGPVKFPYLPREKLYLFCFSGGVVNLAVTWGMLQLQALLGSHSSMSRSVKYRFV